MPFRNRIRLPFYITKPQFPSERNIFRLADGTAKVQSVVIRKVYEGKTDDMPEWFHQRLTIALAHDIVKIEGDRYFGQVALDSEYDIEYQDFLDFPLGKGNFKVQVTPFDATNANCKTCDEANQVVLVDDLFPDPLEEETEYTLNLFDNDTIECQPFIVTVVTFNPQFVASATIDQEGLLTLETTDSFPSANGMKLLTYRVTCPNGGFDEADVYANLEGLSACLAPLNVRAEGIEDDRITFRWDLPENEPITFNYTLALRSNPAVIINSGWVNGNDTEITFLELDPATEYLFSIHSSCEEGQVSQNINLYGETEGVPQTCGKYKVKGPFGDQKNISYMGCNGAILNEKVLQSRTICALENAPGTPVSLIAPGCTIEYQGPCTP